MPDTKLSALASTTARETAKLYGIIGGNPRAFDAESLVADHLSVLLNDFTGSNVNTAQPLFSTPQDTLSLLSDSTYVFDAFCHLTRAAGTTSHTTSFLFGGTATFDAIRYLAQITNPTGNALANVQQIVGEAATAVVLTAANTSATENLMLRINGIIRTAGSGTIIPQFQFSAAPGGAPTVKAGSFFRASRIGSDQFTAFGGWA